MSEIAEMNNKFDLQDTQIDGGSCCYSVVRSRSASSTVQFFRNSLRGQQQRTKDKGIKRVVQNNVKRQQKREKLNKRGIQSAKGMKEGELQMVSKGSYEDVQAVEEVPLKKILATKKCLDYKNKKIQEHHLNSEHIPVITINVRSECNLKPQLTLPQHKQNPTLSLSYDLPFLTPKKTETSASTQKNTPRCLNESGDISIPSHFLSTLLQQAGETYKERLSGSLLKLNKSQKTLERLYERQLGRTMEVFQSQMSEADDLYSVAESFEWRQQ